MRQIVAAGLEETRMSSIENARFMPAALPRITIHPHGHRRGSHLGLDGESNGDGAAQVPVRTAQNLFGRLLHSLEQVIGLQSPAPSAASNAPARASTSSAASTAHADGSQNSRVAGSRISVKA
jgi:hypothetical protein